MMMQAWPFFLHRHSCCIGMQVSSISRILFP